jgi:excisionase family DNA binding protein
MGKDRTPTEEMQGYAVPAAEIQPAWLTYKEAEYYASLSRTTLWRLIESRQIRAARIGKAVRIERNSLDDFLRRSVEEA